MLDTLVNNAYWLLYAGTMIEGETALLLASLAAHQGLIDLTWVIVAAFAGATTGDQISYQVFRRFGPSGLGNLTPGELASTVPAGVETTSVA